MVTRQADALRGYPVDPDPDGPDDRRPDGGYPIAPPHDYYRELTAEEQAIARHVFGDALDLSQQDQARTVIVSTPAAATR